MPKKQPTTQVIPNYFKSKEIERFKQGQHFQLYQKLGAHVLTRGRQRGVYFTVWAPKAKAVSVFGDFNNWKKGDIFLNKRSDVSGLWEGFVPGAKKGDLYKYRIHPNSFRWARDKSDPYAFYTQVSPETASCVWTLNYRWKDKVWMNKRHHKNNLNAPMSIYEVHLGSWKMKDHGEERFMTYREMAEEMVPYVQKMGFTHVEFLPVMEHPYYGSWGYQALGYFAPSSRYGTPQDFMYLIDTFHQNDIGVLLDWVPSHFPNDSHGLEKFDGSRLYELKDMHPDWKSCIFNVGQLQVKDFLISNALFWLEKFHIDGLRVDAVASMLYLDYSRGNKWDPNFFGGVENLDSVAFLRELNQVVQEHQPDVRIIAEESTTWENVSRSTDQGGLDFDMKWNLGWMHDTLQFFSQPVGQRSKYLKQLTHCLDYVFYENFLLTLSHDEVVHMKNSLIGKMPGKTREKFDHLRCLYGFMYAHPGKKLLFMGSEIAQWKEWDHESSLCWDLLEEHSHKGVQNFIQDLNKVYTKEKALYETDFQSDGFSWIDATNKKEGILSFLRRSRLKKDEVLVVFNYKKSYRKGFLIDVSNKGSYIEILNSDHERYGGEHRLNKKAIVTRKSKNPNFSHCLSLDVPPLSVLFLKRKVNRKHA